MMSAFLPLLGGMAGISRLDQACSLGRFECTPSRADAAHVGVLMSVAASGEPYADRRTYGLWRRADERPTLTPKMKTDPL
jgi:hypothetical protein